jgi:hypothetical protein
MFDLTQACTENLHAPGDILERWPREMLLVRAHALKASGRRDLLCDWNFFAWFPLTIDDVLRIDRDKVNGQLDERRKASSTTPSMITAERADAAAMTALRKIKAEN